MTIGVFRIIASYLVWSASNHNFLAFPLILFIIHLALGDTWNTIFTVEGHYGLAVPVVILGPLLSAFAVSFVYGQIVPLAGWLIFPSCIWLIVASALVISIWQLNGKKTNRQGLV
jgi:tryptophan-rich sensory protein